MESEVANTLCQRLRGTPDNHRRCQMLGIWKPRLIIHRYPGSFIPGYGFDVPVNVDLDFYVCALCKDAMTVFDLIDDESKDTITKHAYEEMGVVISWKTVEVLWIKRDF